MHFKSLKLFFVSVINFALHHMTCIDIFIKELIMYIFKWRPLITTSSAMVTNTFSSNASIYHLAGINHNIIMYTTWSQCTLRTWLFSAASPILFNISCRLGNYLVVFDRVVWTTKRTILVEKHQIFI